MKESSGGVVSYFVSLQPGTTGRIRACRGKLALNSERRFTAVSELGDRREAIFRDEEDRAPLLKTLGEVCARTGWRVHAFVLMSNHDHWLIETPEPNLVAAIRWIVAADGAMTTQLEEVDRSNGFVTHITHLPGVTNPVITKSRAGQVVWSLGPDSSNSAHAILVTYNGSLISSHIKRRASAPRLSMTRSLVSLFGNELGAARLISAVRWKRPKPFTRMRIIAKSPRVE